MSRSRILRRLVVCAVAIGSVVAAGVPAYAEPNSTVKPFTNITSCSNPDHKVDIYDYNGHEYCFAGTGYLGFRINGVRQVSTIDYGWMKMYVSGSTNGWFESLHGDGRWYSYPEHRDITQICIHC